MSPQDPFWKSMNELIRDYQRYTSLQILSDLEKVLHGKIKICNIDDFETPLFNAGIQTAISVIKLYKESINPMPQDIKPQKINDDDDYREF